MAAAVVTPMPPEEARALQDPVVVAGVGVAKGRALVVCVATLATMLVALEHPVGAATSVAVIRTRAGEFQPARGDGFFAWERNTGDRPRRFDVMARRDGGGSPFRINAPRTNAANGGIDGNRLVFQQFANGRSDLFLFDLDTKARSALRDLSTRHHWEYWPSISGRWLLFGRFLVNGGRRVLLYDLEDREIRVLAETVSSRAFLAPGQVNGDYAVWSKCSPRGCDVFRYDIQNDDVLKVPNPGRPQRASSVTPEGTVYFIRGRQSCSRFPVSLMRFQEGSAPTRITQLPRRHNVSDTYAYAGATGRRDVLYELYKCGEPANSDIWKVVEPNTFTLDVAREGSGAGTVTSIPEGINCGTDCSHNLRTGTSVTLTATPAPVSTFTGWGGGCSGQSPTCTVTMDSMKSVTANFTGVTHALTVTRTGTGAGVVTGNPAGISCGTDCRENYAPNTIVELTAAAASGSTFAGWSGACSGNSITCTVTMSSARTVHAAFHAINNSLIVEKVGTGTGTVTTHPPDGKIDCGPDCNEIYPYGTTVQVAATPSNSSTFGGWGVSCTGTSSICTVSMDGASRVVARFTLKTYSLTVNTQGNGSGAITSSSTGISCTQTSGIKSGDCGNIYDHGTNVVLTAAEDASSSFGGWVGDCDNTTATTCTMTMDQNRTVTATFESLASVDANTFDERMNASLSSDLMARGAAPMGRTTDEVSATVPRRTRITRIGMLAIRRALTGLSAWLDI